MTDGSSGTHEKLNYVNNISADSDNEHLRANTTVVSNNIADNPKQIIRIEDFSAALRTLQIKGTFNLPIASIVYYVTK